MRKDVFKKTFKAQSAMEYLMTYGWAILIIAVVLGALFSLGVFSGSTLIGTACIASSGYYCQNPLLTTGSVLTFTLGQNTGTTMYNAIVSVAAQGASPNSVGFPSTIVSQTSIATFSSGSTNSVSVTLDSTQLPNNAIGQAFTGYVWINYSSTSGGSATLAQKVATVSVKVT